MDCGGQWETVVEPGTKVRFSPQQRLINNTRLGFNSLAVEAIKVKVGYLLGPHCIFHCNTIQLLCTCPSDTQAIDTPANQPCQRPEPEREDFNLINPRNMAHLTAAATLST